jgi:hypothetical protein
MHPIEEFSSALIARLRIAELSGPAESNAPLVPGISLSWNPDAKGLKVDATSAPGTLLRIEQIVEEAPRWLELHVALGHATFVPGDILGLALRAEGFGDEGPSFFVRTFLDDRFLNTDLVEPLPTARARAVRTVLYTIASTDPIVEPGRFHTLIMRIPKRSGRLAIGDLRLLVLPAARGLNTASPILARAADISATA